MPKTKPKGQRKRKYTLKQRAERQERTRRRIVEAAMALHEEMGPAETTVSAIARRAGVQRLTVYRHFPDDSTIFKACTSTWLELNPPPNPAEWQTHREPLKRSRHAILALYSYYRSTQEMWRKAYRDVDAVPALAAELRGFEAYLDAIRDDLLDVWRPVGTRRAVLSAVVGHTLRFSTWDSLAGEGLAADKVADLSVAWMDAVSPVQVS